MAKNIDHFIFVPGIGAGRMHPAGTLINKGIERLSGGMVSTEIADTCDESENVLVPHSLERQAEALRERIVRKKGRVALFAHSQGGIPTALALEHFDLPQLDPSHVIFAGTPLDSTMSRDRTLKRGTDDPDAHNLSKKS